MKHSSFFSIAISAILGISLASCGGGGSTPLAAPTVLVPVGAEGLYTSTDPYGNRAATLILDDGTFYSTYATPSATTGFVWGKGEVSDSNKFSSNNVPFVFLKALNIQTGLADYEYVATASYFFGATFVKGQTLQSKISNKLNADDFIFTSNYEKSYEQSAKLADIAATYDGTMAVGSAVRLDFVPTLQTSTLTISAGGALSGTVTGGCTFSGLLAPHVQGNAFNATVFFGDAPCPLPKTTVLGHAFVDPQTKRLNVVTVMPDKTKGVLFSYAKK